MDTQTFFLFQMSWYVFGAVSAFAAAFLFWDKGTAQVDSRHSKVTGAAAIFVAILLVVHVINPLTPLSEFNKVRLAYSSSSEAAALQAGEAAQFELDLSDCEALGMCEWLEGRGDLSNLAIALIPASIADLEHQGRTVTASQPIAPGVYKMLLDSRTDLTKDYMIEVPWIPGS